MDGRDSHSIKPFFYKTLTHAEGHPAAGRDRSISLDRMRENVLAPQPDHPAQTRVAPPDQSRGNGFVSRRADHSSTSINTCSIATIGSSEVASNGRK